MRRMSHNLARHLGDVGFASLRYSPEDAAAQVLLTNLVSCSIEEVQVAFKCSADFVAKPRAARPLLA